MFIADLPPSPPSAETIVVTAARVAEQRRDTPASVTVLGSDRLEQAGVPQLTTLLRLTPSASLSQSGPAGSQTQLRLRGNEANHTLLFIDGIRANDPAAANEPRFELLSADLGDSVEIVRGPQSALWGSEAIGGVVAVRAGQPVQPSALVEAGSLGFARASGKLGTRSGPWSIGLAGGVQRARGINAFADGPGDRDGYRNASLRGRLTWSRGPLEVDLAGFAAFARAQFDGIDPVLFVRADTRDQGRNRLGAARFGLRYEENGWIAHAGVSRLLSSNRNLLGPVEQNRTSGRRDSASGDLSRIFTVGSTSQRLTVAADFSRERFVANDVAFGGFTNQRRTRNQAAVTAEWRGEASPVVVTAALRRDHFNRFDDATTFRVGALIDLTRGWQLAASHGEGIAQPSFFDLYGFFPGSFRGNPALRPERSRGGEIALRKSSGRLTGSVAVFDQSLRDEIVERFDIAAFFSTVANSAEKSRRRGLEVEANWKLSPGLSLDATYSYLRASESSRRELRRARHSGSVAVGGARDRLSYHAAISYTGARQDRDFDAFPAPLVRLRPYWLADTRLGYELSRQVTLFGRIGNAFSAEAVDVFGYRSEGRTFHAGIQLRPRR